MDRAYTQCTRGVGYCNITRLSNLKNRTNWTPKDISLNPLPYIYECDERRTLKVRTAVLDVFNSLFTVGDVIVVVVLVMVAECEEGLGWSSKGQRSSRSRLPINGVIAFLSFIKR